MLLKIWALSQENQTLLNANNTGVDQPAHLSSQISTFVTTTLVSIVSIVDELATWEVLVLQLVYS